MENTNETVKTNEKGRFNMSKRAKLVIAGLGIAALIAVPVVGTAFAAASGNAANAGNTSVNGQFFCGSGGFYGGSNAVSTLLGLTPAEIQTQLQSGKSLVDIASTKEVTESALTDAILSPMKQQMQLMVTNTVLTQAQADQMLQLMTQNVKKAVNTKGYSVGNGTDGYGMMEQGGMMGSFYDNPGNTNADGANGGWGGMMGGVNGSTGRGGMMSGGMMGGLR